MAENVQPIDEQEREAQVWKVQERIMQLKVAIREREEKGGSYMSKGCQLAREHLTLT